jgi:hypothetical protein
LQLASIILTAVTALAALTALVVARRTLAEAQKARTEERAWQSASRELNRLYRVDERLADLYRQLEAMGNASLASMPPAWVDRGVSFAKAGVRVALAALQGQALDRCHELAGATPQPTVLADAYSGLRELCVDALGEVEAARIVVATKIERWEQHQAG